MSAFGHRVSSLSLEEGDERLGTGPVRQHSHHDGVVTPSVCSLDDSFDWKQRVKREIRRTRRRRPFIRLITYNIQHAGCINLNMALRAMDQMHMDFGVFTETRLDHDFYTKFCCGYNVLATKDS